MHRPGAAHVHLLLFVEVRHGLVVGLDARVLDVLAVRSWCSTTVCGGRGLTSAGWAGSGVPTHMPNTANTSGGSSSRAATSSGVVAHAADVHHAEAERLAAAAAFCAARAASMTRRGTSRRNPARPRGARAARRCDAGGQGRPATRAERRIPHMRLAAGELGEAARLPWSRTATTLQTLRLEELAADRAAAMMAASCASLTGSGR